MSDNEVSDAKGLSAEIFGSKVSGIDPAIAAATATVGAASYLVDNFAHIPGIAANPFAVSCMGLAFGAATLFRYLGPKLKRRRAGIPGKNANESNDVAPTPSVPDNVAYLIGQLEKKKYDNVSEDELHKIDQCISSLNREGGFSIRGLPSEIDQYVSTAQALLRE